MKIDVIISILNGADYIEAAVDSVLKQTYTDWRLYLIDNASTDSTFEILKRYQSEHKDKIFVSKYEKNEKPSHRWMQRINDSDADAIAISCHDDIWDPNKLQQQVEIMKNKDIDVVHTNIEIIDSSGKLIKGRADKENNYRNKIDYKNLTATQLAKEFCEVNFIRLSSVLIKTEVFNKFGGWEKGIWGGEDWGLWVKLAAKECSFYQLKESLVLRRVHVQNASSSSRYDRSFGFIKAMEIVKKNYPYLKNSITKKETIIHERIIFQTITRKQYKTSRKYSNFFMSKDKKSFRDILFVVLAYSGFFGNFILKVKQSLK